MAEIDNINGEDKMLRIKELRKQQNITQQQLSNYLGITQATLSGWENEKFEIDNNSLMKCADYFNVSLDYLLGRTNDCSVKVNTVTDNHGIIGHNHAPVTIINGSERKLSEQEVALINLFEKLDVLKKAQLLTYAAKLTEEEL